MELCLFKKIKKVKNGLLTFLFSMFLFSVYAQKQTTREYIEKYKANAIQEMIRSGVPASITLAQGVLETESGNSELVRKSNNHFGIKCKAEWTGEKVYHDDDESGECFRKYDSSHHSYRDHSDFLRTRAHYAFLFSLDPTDYKGWAHGLKKAGYATNPRYPQILIKTIEEHQLNDYTIEGMKSIPDYAVFVLKTNDPKPKVVQVIDKTIGKVEELIFPKNPKIKLFNGLKAVQVDSGTSLLALAIRYQIDLEDLLDYNDLLEDGILDGSTLIYLQRKRLEALQNTYKVKQNDNLYDISQSLGIQLSYLMAYNGVNEGDYLKPGTILSLKSIMIDEKEKVVTEVKYHKVKPSESLKNIAKKYKVSVSDIKEWNKLETETIIVGQRLIISK
jgi:LysM repeat protein